MANRCRIGGAGGGVFGFFSTAGTTAEKDNSKNVINRSER
jgi:hypothetical protein